MRRVSMALVLAVVLAAGCRTADAPAQRRPGPAVASPDAPAGSEPRAPGKAHDGASTPSGEGGLQPAFAGEIQRIDSAVRARMSFSWRQGCPVGFGDLRLLTLSFWGFDRRVHTGELVVHEDASRDVVNVFQELFEAEFPVDRMRLVDEYEGDDDRSMGANNTSGFNCREATGHPGVWSEHSYGRAIDINPLVNPYVASDRTVLPPAGARYADRSGKAKGMILEGDLVVRAFASIGWEWGGSWSSIKDYQHFSATGR
jgi:hypothetical protein